MSQLELIDGKLVISEKEGIGSDKEWYLLPVSSKRYIVQSSDTEESESKNGLGWCPIGIVSEVIKGIITSKLTGSLSLGIGEFVKKIYFKNGDIVFASSTLIDDRLAEVAYRHHLINIDDLVSSTVQVTKEKKFGRVLLDNKVFSNYKLWESLKQQVKAIIKSVFLVDNLYYEWKEDDLAFTEINFEENSIDLIDSFYIEGVCYRNFVKNLNTKAKISLNDWELSFSPLKEGTFLYDFISLIKTSETVENLVKNCKLNPSYTYYILLLCLNKGLCYLDFSFLNLIDNHQSRSLLKSIEAYDSLVTIISSSFKKQNLEFPIQSLREVLFNSEEDINKISINKDLKINEFVKQRLILMSSLDKKQYE